MSNLTVEHDADTGRLALARRVQIVCFPVHELPRLLTGEIAAPLMPDLPRDVKVERFDFDNARGLVFLRLSHHSFKPVQFKDEIPITFLMVKTPNIAGTQNVARDG